MKTVIICLALTLPFWLLPTQASGQHQNKAEKALTEKKIFIENKGQWPDEVLYLTQLPGVNVWITKSGARYDYFELFDLPESAYTDHDRYLMQRYKEKKQGVAGHVVGIVNYQANIQPVPHGKGKLSAYYNYFLGNDSSRWASDVGLYEEVIVKDVYQGIDQRWYYDQGNLRYDYIVHPYSNPNQIQLDIQGVSNIQIKENNLFYQTRFGEVQHSNLYVYQTNENNQKKNIAAGWNKNNEKIVFHIADYDRSKPLIIDPIIQSTYIGGNNNDLIYDLATPGDPSEKYICGATLSANYPTNIGAYDGTYSANFDVVVTRFSIGLNSLQFSTFIGHTGEERAYGIAVNTIDGIYITGITYSISFPTVNAYDNSYANNGDVFVAKLNISGNSLIYSTFIGFNGTDQANAITINDAGEAFITGQTNGGFPITAGVVQTTLQGTQNAFILKLNATGNTLGYSTYLGRSNDIAYSIKTDRLNNVYISGETFSNNLPVTAGAADATYNGGKDAFAAKLNATATQILALTYLGGGNDEIFAKIDVDYNFNVYVAGGSASTDYPTTVGAYVNNPGNTNFDVFVTKLNPNFTSMLYSSKFGQTFDDYAQDIVVDAGGFAHIAAFVNGASFPVTAGADFITSHGNNDIAIVKLNQNGSGLVYSSYYGGANNDIVTAIDLNYFQLPRLNASNRTVTFAGFTSSSNYHTAGVPFQSTNAGGTNDGFCTSLQLCAIVNPNTGNSIPFTNSTCSGSPVNYTMNATGGASPYTFIWTEHFGNIINTAASASLSPVQTTQYVYVAVDNNGCVGSNITTLVVNPTSSAGTPSSSSACLNQAISPAITINTTNATGIGTPSGLPPGVTANFSSNTISLVGTPTTSGIFNYTIPLTGTCPGNATGTLEIISSISFAGPANQTTCVNSVLSPMTFTTTGVSSIGTPTNLPPGVNATYSSNTVTISGTPTASGTFNYSIPLNGCGTSNISGTITVNPTNTFSGTTNGTTCINNSLTPIVLTTTGATGISGVINLPAGVSAAYSSNTITISGTPTVAGSFNYSINLDGGCGNVTVTGTITVNANNTVTGSGNQTVCVNSTLSPIVFTTTGATGIGSPSGLPPGVTATWNANTLTISGTPTTDGVFNYSIPLSGGCGNTSATGTISVNPANTIFGSGNQTVCMNDALTPITFTTTGATGIGTPSSLPFGVTAGFNSNTITISGTPTNQGVFNYSIPLTGGCGSVNATGTITVNGFITYNPITSTFAQACTNTPITPIMYLVTGATSIGSVSNLPPGVNASLSADTLIISGIPTTIGSYNFDVIVNGCGAANASGFINVIAGPTISGNSNQTLCAGSSVSVSVTTSQVFNIGTPTGLPAGVSASFNGNSVSITGTSNVPGVYNYSIPLISDCDNVTLTGTITLNGADASVTQSGITLTANQPGATYQWINCENGNAPIAGETNQSFTPAVSGNYAVEVTDNGCTNTSTCTTITIGTSALDENHESNYLLYPNPASTIFTVVGIEPGSILKIIDMTGKMVCVETVTSNMYMITIETLADGVYIVQIENNGQTSQKKLVINK